MSIILQVLRFTHKNSNKLEFKQWEKGAIKIDQPKKHSQAVL